MWLESSGSASDGEEGHQDQGNDFPDEEGQGDPAAKAARQSSYARAGLAVVEADPAERPLDPLDVWPVAGQ